MKKKEEENKKEEKVVEGEGEKEEKEMNNLISTRMSAMHFVVCHLRKPFYNSLFKKRKLKIRDAK